jgi:hypothetical protein
MSKHFIHTLRKTFVHKGITITCIMTQALNYGYSDHGHYNIVFMNDSGDVLHTDKSYNGPPPKILTLDEKIDNFKRWGFDLIDDLYQGE